MHIFVIDFVLVQIWGLLLFLQEFLQDLTQHEWHMYAKTPYSKQLAICGW